MKKILILATLLFFGTSGLFAQLIDVTPEVTTLCTGGSTTLSATVNPPGTGGVPGSLPTTSYTVSSIPFSPAPLTGGTGTSMSDDSQTGALPIGFTFCFFGNSYTNFYIGSNGWIAFSSQPTTYTAATIPSTAATVPKNCVMGPWQDWRPDVGSGSPYIHYQTLGVAPFRKLVVNWTACPMYSCTTTYGTFQIVIYETTNVIENYLINKPNCLSWPTTSPGSGTEGIHNAAGTIAFVVPGRNNTQWTASNEGWRYTPSGASTYTVNWYILPANTLIGTNTFTVPPTTLPYTTTINVTPPTSPQYYYASVTGPNGCGSITAPNTDTVVVNSTNLIVDAGNYTPVCQGNTTTLNASGGTSYSWSPATGLSNPSIANPVASPTTTTTYTVTVVGAAGCTGTDTVTVAVSPTPLTDAGFGGGICRGDNIQLNGNGSGNYSWSPAGSLDNATIATPTASPTVTTTYTLTITNASGCSASDTATVFVLNPAANAGADTAICAGAGTPLNASGGTDYSWSPAAGLSSTTISNPVATPTVTTTYTVVVTNSSTGCSATDSVTITVNPLPVADAGTNTSICQGFNTTLGASGGTIYAWTPTSGISDSTIFNPVASPTTTTTYSVNVTDASGCVSHDSVTVTVNPLPTVSAGPDLSLCTGSSATLNGSGATNYVWSPGATLSDSTIANPVTTPTVATTYTLVGTDVNGCVNTDTVSVTLNGLVITASANTAICAGNSTTLSVTGALTYVWSPAASLNNDTLANPVATPIGTTTYTVIGTAGNGCSDTAFVTVTVNPLPVVNAGSSLSICIGSTANLSVTGATSYVWTPGGALNDSTISNPISSATVTTFYTVYGTDANGCTASDTISVMVHPIPVANAGPNVGICAGSSTTLGASGGGTYSWSPATGLSSTVIANPIATPSVTTTYTVTVMGAGFCTATSQVTVTVNALPVASVSPDVSICSGASTVLTASGGTTYTWVPPTGLSSSTTATTTATPSATTMYVVLVGNAAGCTDRDTVVVTVSNALVLATASATPETCSDNDGQITTGSVTGGTGPFTYSLNGGASQPSSTFTGLNQGFYTILVTDANGCSATQTASVGQISNVNASFTATPPSGTKPLNVSFTNTSTGATNFAWDFGNGDNSFSTNATTTYNQDGNYTVVLYATNGGAPCIDSVTFTIHVFEDVLVMVPNVFTPNGDGKNEIFGITSNSTGVAELSGQIFNRWGKEVYSWTGSANSGWDGKINGNKAEDGTYYYILKITGGDGKDHEEKGYVQLLSN
ncbi:MAG: hypothetical protein JWP12_2317 [Bacteroidetes bacterium]|nr:hypothetical protein [Bacteroidota bacterium]